MIYEELFIEEEAIEYYRQGDTLMEIEVDFKLDVTLTECDDGSIDVNIDDFHIENEDTNLYIYEIGEIKPKRVISISVSDYCKIVDNYIANDFDKERIIEYFEDIDFDATEQERKWEERTGR